jgi:2-hydroxymuconate-semialdehyde hydrolase
MFRDDKQRYIDAAVLDDATLGRVRCPVLMVHGRDDKPFPFAETTLVLGRKLVRADIAIIAECGHSPALEHPKKLVDLAGIIFG